MPKKITKAATDAALYNEFIAPPGDAKAVSKNYALT